MFKPVGVSPEFGTLNLPNTNQFDQPARQKAEENIFTPEHSSYFYFHLFSNCTIMRHLTTEIQGL